jgi:uncharacterized PurR-regulated membrane protein YhhQ (DUF165 family)
MMNRIYKSDNPLSTAQISAKLNIRPYNIICLVFIFTMILANISSVKILTFNATDILSSFYVIPFIYSIIAVTAEIYGNKASIKLIWFSVIVSATCTLMLYLTAFFPDAPDIELNGHYNNIMVELMKITWGNIIALIIAGYINSILISKSKLKFVGKYLAARTLFSSIFSLSLHGLIFCLFASIIIDGFSFSKIIPSFIMISALIQFVMYPIASIVINYLKDKDQIEHFDFKT